MAKAKKNKKALNFNKHGLKRAILEVYYDNSNQSFNYKQIGSAVGAKNVGQLQLVNVVLQELRDAD